MCKFSTEEEKARKRADKEREIVEDMIEEREEVHYRSRQSPYPGTQIIRFPVADSQVPWRVCRSVELFVGCGCERNYSFDN